jgi:hypothetical protein
MVILNLRFSVGMALAVLAEFREEKIRKPQVRLLGRQSNPLNLNIPRSLLRGSPLFRPVSEESSKLSSVIPRSLLRGALFSKLRIPTHPGH